MKSTNSQQLGSNSLLPEDSLRRALLIDAALPKFARMTFEDFDRFISSLASEFGVTPSVALASRMILQFGPEAAPANLSAQQAKERGWMTSGTYGRTSTTSSESARLLSSLASRLQAKTDSVGSTLYKLTWKERATPSGQLIPALRASVPRISDSDSTGSQSGWVTASARDWKDSGNDIAPRLDTGKDRFDQLPRQAVLSGWGTPTASEPGGTAEAYVARSIKKTGNQSPTMLAHQAPLSGWQSPRPFDVKTESPETRDLRDAQHKESGNWRGIGSYPNPTLAQLAAWSTPTVAERERSPETLAKVAKRRLEECGQTTTPLYHCEQAKLCGWQTPTTDNFRSRGGDRKDEMGSQQAVDWSATTEDHHFGPARLTAFGDLLIGSSAGMESGGPLNPELSRWLMGLPPEWGFCGAMAMPSSPPQATGFIEAFLEAEADLSRADALRSDFLDVLG